MSINNTNKHWPIDMTHINFEQVTDGSIGGMLPKAVIKDSYGNITTFLKTDNFSIGTSFYNHCALSEFIGSIIGKAMNFDVLEYKAFLAKVNIADTEYITIVNSSHNFNPNGSYIAIEKLYDRKSEKSTKDFFFEKGYKHQIELMWIFDYIISNMDRHGHNIEVDIRTGKFAPLFDNGLTHISGASRLDRISDCNDSSNVNNFIGSKNLLDNLMEVSITHRVKKIRYIENELKSKLQGLCTEQEIESIWNFLKTRINTAMALGKIVEE